MTKTPQQKSFVRCLLPWARINYRNFEWRNNRDPYRVFVAETLLRRTTSKAADRIFCKFLERYPSIHELVRADPNVLAEHIRPIGLYQQRSKGLVRAACYLNEKYNGKFPVTLDDLLGIPHVGEYAARCILSFGMGIPVPVVDSNVQRVISRVFEDTVGPRPSVRHITTILLELLPKKSHVEFNYGLIDFGSLVCTYRSCHRVNCPMRAICDYIQE